MLTGFCSSGNQVRWQEEACPLYRKTAWIVLNSGCGNPRVVRIKFYPANLNWEEDRQSVFLWNVETGFMTLQRCKISDTYPLESLKRHRMFLDRLRDCKPIQTKLSCWWNVNSGKTPCCRYGMLWAFQLLLISWVSNIWLTNAFTGDWCGCMQRMIVTSRYLMIFRLPCLCIQLTYAAAVSEEW